MKHLRFGAFYFPWLAMVLTGTLLVRGEEKVSPPPEKYLFVWASDPSRKAPDFLTVVNFDESSPKYGKVIAIAALPYKGSSENEPHPVALSKDGNVLACGGLLNLPTGPKQIFFFDVSSPTHPKLISDGNPPLSASPGEFYALGDGGFLVTMMCGTQRRHPGRVAEFDKNLKFVAEYPKDLPEDGFSPYGISVRPEINLMATSDYSCPFTPLSGISRDSNLPGRVRVWDLTQRKVLRTIEFPGAGETVDVCLIPGDGRFLAYTAGMGNNQLYLVNTADGLGSRTVVITRYPFRSVFDFSTIAEDGGPQLLRMTADGKRLFVALNRAGKVIMLDTSNPLKPKLLKVLDLGKDSGPHNIALTKDGKRLVITDFLSHKDDSEQVLVKRDHKVWVAKVTSDNLMLDRRFKLNFSIAFPSGPVDPHGAAMK